MKDELLREVYQMSKNLPQTPTCHPDRKHYAKGLCASCYNKVKSYKLSEAAERHKKDKRLQKTYGIDLEILEDFLESIGFKCMICKKPIIADGKTTKNKACIDHDHITGKIRGLLCFNCNMGIGYLKDNPIFLFSAAKYLQWAKE